VKSRPNNIKLQQNDYKHSVSNMKKNVCQKMLKADEASFNE